MKLTLQVTSVGQGKKEMPLPWSYPALTGNDAEKSCYAEGQRHVTPSKFWVNFLEFSTISTRGWLHETK